MMRVIAKWPIQRAEEVVQPGQEVFGLTGEEIERMLEAKVITVIVADPPPVPQDPPPEGQGSNPQEGGQPAQATLAADAVPPAPAVADPSLSSEAPQVNDVPAAVAAEKEEAAPAAPPKKARRKASNDKP
ncbi:MULTISPECIES: hypothetical protein [Paenibacillus]|uniref:hypothetical protein n=1 Tax=Paenibacillus TaxID=44249 RepID=UPI0022B88E7E|nr:hypothetical protein [Paenibacillus caseinilyticus]MCZ8520132.1 hypothetical protein [Paenibacillus caseinilyticus]